MRFKEITEEDVVEVIEESDAPAITIDEVTRSLDCSPRVAQRNLNELFKKGRIDKKRTEKVTIWWLVEDHPANKIPSELRNRLENYKREGESLKEVFERLKGSPPRDLIESIVGDVELDAENMKYAVNKRREMGKRGRKDIQDRFK